MRGEHFTYDDDEDSEPDDEDSEPDFDANGDPLPPFGGSPKLTSEHRIEALLARALNELTRIANALEAKKRKKRRSK